MKHLMWEHRLLPGLGTTVEIGLANATPFVVTCFPLPYWESSSFDKDWCQVCHHVPFVLTFPSVTLTRENTNTPCNARGHVVVTEGEVAYCLLCHIPQNRSQVWHISVHPWSNPDGKQIAIGEEVISDGHFAIWDLLKWQRQGLCPSYSHQLCNSKVWASKGFQHQCEGHN